MQHLGLFVGVRFRGEVFYVVLLGLFSCETDLLFLAPFRDVLYFAQRHHPPLRVRARPKIA